MLPRTNTAFVAAACSQLVDAEAICNTFTGPATGVLRTLGMTRPPRTVPPVTEPHPIHRPAGWSVDWVIFFHAGAFIIAALHGDHALRDQT